MSPVTVTGEVLPASTQAPVPTRYWYLVIAAPPVAAGVNDTDADPSPATATSPVGAAGTVRGVTDTGSDAAPAPTEFTARSRRLYEVPFVSPGIVTGLDVTAGENATHAPSSS